jgi:hypothetical protein
MARLGGPSFLRRKKNPGILSFAAGSDPEFSNPL